MSENNAPQGRRRKIIGQGQMGETHGEGLGTGPVGNDARPADADENPKAQSPRPPRPNGSPKPPENGADGKEGEDERGLGSAILGSMLGGGKPSGSGLSGLGSLLGGGQSSGSKPSGSSLGGLGSLLGGGLGSLFGGSTGGSSGSGSSGGSSGNSGKGKLLLIAVLILLAIFVLPRLFGGNSSTQDSYTGTGSTGLSNTVSQGSSGFSVSDLLGSFLTSGANVSYPSSSYGASSYGADTNDSVFDTRVAAGSRDKYFTPKRSAKSEKVTVMIYMCGTDLESRSSMATKDLQEIAKATYGDNVRVVVYTGGCTGWHVKQISSSVNQIWQVESGGKITCLREDGNKPMTDPATLTGFLNFCETDSRLSGTTRRILIFWDHGGGSVSGYGYDEKAKAGAYNGRGTGTMTLPNIQKALSDARMEGKLDFIGFDACLMATVETALMAEPFADYMIASEETEPGVGWYYTDWMNALGAKPNTPTLELGKTICDSFVEECNRTARGQSTTLSVVDLAEAARTIPDALKAFSTSVTGLVKNNSYQTVASARSGAREFAASSAIDQVDIADLATRIGNSESKALAEVVQDAVKYNRSGSMTGAYGLSIYFPYRKAANVGKAVSANEQIDGMDDSYNECIRAFAAMGSAGGYAGYTGNSASAYGNSPFTALSGGSYTSSASSLGGITDLLSLFMRSMPEEDAAASANILSGADVGGYIGGHSLNGGNFKLLIGEDGNAYLPMKAEEWALVTDVALNMFYDDGSGYLDFGLDNVFEWNSAGYLTCDKSGAWIGMMKQGQSGGLIVPYYLERTAGGVTYGYIPVLLSGEAFDGEERYDLITRVDSEGDMAIIGARRVYREAEGVEVLAKADGTADLFGSPDVEGDNLLETGLFAGAPVTVQVVCDRYGYDGTYQDSYRYGDPFVCENGLGELVVGDMELPADLLGQYVLSYRITDIYQQNWWTTTYRLK